jgi:hydrogenase maturation protein HypF
LKPVPLPRSDVAGKHPWRCALAYLLSINENPLIWLPPFRALSGQEQTILRQYSEQNGRSIPSSSIGRLIDAVASILDLVHDNEFEAHAAMRLEQAAWIHFHAKQVQGHDPIRFEDRYRFPAVWRDGKLLFDYSVPLVGILKDIDEQLPVTTIAYRFHGALLDVIFNALKSLTENEVPLSESEAMTGPPFSLPATKTIGCTGGVFQNALLVAALEHHLPSHGWQLLTHRQIPPNDAGISIGQAWISTGR